MHTCFDDLNGKKLVIGLVHLLPMVSTPLYQDGNLDKMTQKAIEDCLTLKKNGADGGLIQTVDVFYPSTDDTDYARVAGLAAVTARVRDAVGPDFILGAQIMMNCITPSLAVCKAAGADFTRCSALVGKVETLYGTMEGQPLKVADYRKKIEAQNIGMIIEKVKSMNIKIYDVEITRMRAADGLNPGAIFSIRLPKKGDHSAVMASIGEIPSVVSVEEV